MTFALSYSKTNYYLARIRKYLREEDHFVKLNSKLKWQNKAREFDPTITAIRKGDKIIMSSGFEVLQLNPCKDIMATLIHESLHGLYYDTPEKRIIELENAIMAKATDRQFKNLLKIMVDKLI
ncbi:MAG: hypothetical protein EHM41_00105 [Chloroflexi bacterium]|nr:MAG: hypothetical protein EHM41_00105 [Chloroflexota bacterium]